jgi:hypothetical protein
VAHACNPSYSESRDQGARVVQSQPRQIVLKTLSRKTPSQKRAGGVAQGKDTKFKPQYYKKEKKHNVQEHKNLKN